MGGMDRKLALLLVVLAFGTVTYAPHVAYGQVGQNPEDAVVLAYRFAPGDTVKYRISQHVTGSRTIPGAASPTPIDIELASVIRLRWVRALPEGAMEIAVETEAETLKLAGKEARHYERAKEPKVFRIAPSGKIVAPDHKENPGKRLPRSPLDFGSIESIVLMAILPETPVSLGDKWSAEMPLPVSPSAKLQMAFKLEDLRQTPGGRVATIKQVLNTPINSDVGDDSGQPHGSQEGQATLTFAVDQGRLTSAQGTIRSELRAKAAVPSVPGGEASASSQNTLITVLLNSKFSVELISPAAKSSSSPGK